MSIAYVLAAALIAALACIVIMDGAYSDLRKERDDLADSLDLVLESDIAARRRARSAETTIVLLCAELRRHRATAPRVDARLDAQFLEVIRGEGWGR